MPKKLIALALALPLLGGCFPNMIKTANVRLVQGGAYGKAIFVVRPVDTDQRCQIQVKTSDGRDSVDCNNEYLVACDIDIPLDQPFCQLVRELGVERDSVYPATRRK